MTTDFTPAPLASPLASSLASPTEAPLVFLRQLYQAAVTRALPLHTLGSHLPPPPKGRTVVLGAGKAGGAMAQAVEALWPADAPLSGLVITRYHHIPPRPVGLPVRIELVEAAHPVPDAAGLAASARMLALTQDLSADDLVLCLISGGGSALMTLPAEGLSFADKQRINQDLLNSGANIGEMNCVRKHLSRIKGGRLAAACAPAQVVTLTISDVPGDDPSVIASGPTVPDTTTCADALHILQRYNITLPAGMAYLLTHNLLETPKPGDSCFTGHSVRMIATPQQSLEAAATLAAQAGIAAYILSDEMEGESREVGKVHAALARSVARRGQPFSKPCVILSGGETTVTVRPQAVGSPRGRGGRAGEFCLGLALALQGQPGVWALAADTDGIDGIEDNAGAQVTPSTLARAEAQGLKITTYLDRNNAYSYFAALNDLVTTGPTHTNVNDFRAVLVL
jgi:hydroxypyruvate reductase